MAIGANDTPRPVMDFLCRELREWKMVHEMRYWARRHSSLATYLVIYGNKALSSTLEKLHTRNYNILLAHPKGLLTDLAGIASCLRDFEGLLRGESPYRVRTEMVPRMTCPLPKDEKKCLDIVDNIYCAVFANCSCTHITIMVVGTNHNPQTHFNSPSF